MGKAALERKAKGDTFCLTHLLWVTVVSTVLRGPGTVPGLEGKHSGSVAHLSKLNSAMEGPSYWSWRERL